MRLAIVCFAFLLVLIGFSLTSLSPASAAVMEVDWKTPGDGLLTYDTVNKRKWLDLSQTLGRAKSIRTIYLEKIVLPTFSLG